MKNHYLHLSCIIGLLLLFCTTDIRADEIIYSRGDSAVIMGTENEQAETYDVAQILNDRALVGMRIKALRVTFPYSSGITDAKVWLSSSLPDIKSQRMQQPDIATQEFYARKGYTEVVFSEPYTITEDSIFVGYTFKLEVNAPGRKPVVTTRKSSIGGFFIHSSKKYRTAWHDLYTKNNDLAIQIVLEGDEIRENAAGVGNVMEIKGKTGKVNTTTVEIINHGSKGVKSFDYTYEIAGQTGSRHVTLTGSNVLPGIVGRSTTFNVQLPSVAEKGAYPVMIEITKVNDEVNEDPGRRGQGLASLYNSLPKHRAVLEEYTGTWCGYCPRGFVGLEEMNRLYPDDFIGLSYHNNDPMEVMSSGQFPSAIAGFPAAFIDRDVSTDAFCGFSAQKTFGIDAIWKTVCETPAPAEVDAAATWVEDSVLKATAMITFPVGREDCPYEIGFVLSCNGLKGSGQRWAQANYYSGDTGWPSSMKQFTDGGSYVNGLTYNFVVVARSGKSGIEGSIKTPIEEDVTQTYDYLFDIRKVVNTAGDLVVQDKNNLVVVVLLIDKETGVIMNANKVSAGHSTVDISQLTSTQEMRVKAVDYYDLSGRRVTIPEHGLYIRQEKLENGQIITRKVKL